MSVNMFTDNAMQVLQKEMEGEAERAGLYSDDDITALVKELRKAVK